MRYLFLSLLGLFLLAPLSSVSAYDIRNDFCGVHINFQYCKCAFHGEYCTSIGLSQSAANTYVQSEFDKWVSAKEEAIKIAEQQAKCTEAGGIWSNETCVIDEPEEEPVEEMVEEPIEEVLEEIQEVEGAITQGSDEAACLQKLNHKYDAKTKKCSCHQLYKESTDKEDCYFIGDDGLDLEVETAIDFQEILENLQPGQGTAIEVEDKNGTTLMIGVVRKPNGDYEFTKDGVTYFDNAQEAVKPTVLQKVKQGFSSAWRTVTGWFGIGKYTGRDTKDNPEKQAEGQARLDASTAAFKDLREIGSDPEKQASDAKAVYDLWKGRSKDLLGENYESFILSELKNATGYDVDQIRKVLTGDVEGLTTDKINSIQGALYTFPADAVETLATELRNNDFATGASLYMNERETGKDPALVYTQLLRGELPELEYKQLTGISQQYAQASMLLAYEDAYQRYLLAKQLNQ